MQSAECRAQAECRMQVGAEGPRGANNVRQGSTALASNPAEQPVSPGAQVGGCLPVCRRPEVAPGQVSISNFIVGGGLACVD